MCQLVNHIPVISQQHSCNHLNLQYEEESILPMNINQIEGEEEKGEEGEETSEIH